MKEQFKDMGDMCLWCRKSTAFGSGRFVNRIPADTSDPNDGLTGGETGYQCADCESKAIRDFHSADMRRNLVAWLLKRGCTITVHDDGEVLGEKNETSITKIMADLNSVYECSLVAYKDGKSLGSALTLNSEQGMVAPSESVADFSGAIIDEWFNARH
jgi:hypothetical protein